MALDKKIRKFRHKKELTQQEVADYLNISQSTYNNYESGKHPVQLEHLPKLAELFEVELADFFEGKIKVVNKSKNQDSAQGHVIVINVNNPEVAEKLGKSIELVSSNVA